MNQGELSRNSKIQSTTNTKMEQCAYVLEYEHKIKEYVIDFKLRRRRR